MVLSKDRHIVYISSRESFQVNYQIGVLCFALNSTFSQEIRLKPVPGISLFIWPYKTNRNDKRYSRLSHQTTYISFQTSIILTFLYLFNEKLMSFWCFGLLSTYSMKLLQVQTFHRHWWDEHEVIKQPLKKNEIKTDTLCSISEVKSTKRNWQNEFWFHSSISSSKFCLLQNVYSSWKIGTV